MKEFINYKSKLKYLKYKKIALIVLLCTFGTHLMALGNEPQITSTPSTVVVQDANYSYDLVAVDPNNDPLTWSILNKPSWIDIVYNPDVSTITTIAGTGSQGYTGDGAAATAATLKYPSNIKISSNNDIFILDAHNKAVRKIEISTGIISTVVLFTEHPSQMAIDSSDNLYVTFELYHKIVKIDATTYNETIYAGGGSDSTSENIISTDAFLSRPAGIAIDSDDNVYVSLVLSHIIRKIDAVTSRITTVAGTLSTSGYDGDGGLATSAKLNTPKGLVVDDNGDMYISDVDNYVIRKVDAITKNISTIAGIQGQNGTPSEDALAVNEKLSSYIGGLAIHSNYLYVADQNNNAIRKIELATNIITTVVSSGLSQPKDVAFNHLNKMYILDGFNHSIKSINPTLHLKGAPTFNDTGVHDVSLSVSDGEYSDSQNFQITVSEKNYQPIISTTQDNINIKVGETFTYQALVSDKNEENLTFSLEDNLSNWLTIDANTSMKVFVGSDSATTGDEDGNTTIAKFKNPNKIVFDSHGNLFVADEYNHKIRKVSPSGEVTTFAGSGEAGNVDGTGSEAQFNYPRGIGIDSSDNLYVASGGNYNIRKITPQGVVTTFATSVFSGMGVAVDSANNVYVSAQAQGVFKFDSSGNKTVIAGTADAIVNGDASTAKFAYPRGITVDKDDNVYVADSDTTAGMWIRKIDVNGNVTTYAGEGTNASTDGDLTTSQFNMPYDLKFDSQGNLYVADNQSRKIRKISPKGVVSTLKDNDGVDYNVGYSYGIAIDKNDDLFVSTYSTYHNILKIDLGVKITGTATSADVGIHDINFTVSDGEFNTTQNFQITVVGSVSAEDLNLTIDEDGSFSFNNDTFNFSDISKVQSIIITSLPENGDLTIFGNRIMLNQSIPFNEIQYLVYSPDKNKHGDDSFKYKVSDGEMNSGIYTTSINITSIDDTPNITNPNSIDAIVGTEFIFPLALKDVDGDDLNWTIRDNTTLPNWLSINNGQSLSGTPTSADIGISNIHLNVSDGITSESYSFSIITYGTTPLITTTPTRSGSQDTLYSYILDAKDSDDVNLTWTTTEKPDWLSLEDAYVAQSVTQEISYPTTMIFDSNNALYFYDQNTKKIMKKEADGLSVYLSLEDYSSHVQSMAFNSSDILYFIVSQKIYSYDGTNTTLIYEETNNNLTPQYLAIQENGDIYFIARTVLNGVNSRVVKIDSTGNNKISILGNGEIVSPYAMTIDKTTGDLYISDDKKIKKWDGTNLTKVLDTPIESFSIYLDDKGLIYYIGSTHSTYYLNAYDGTESKLIFSDTNSFLTLSAMDNNNNIYIDGDKSSQPFIIKLIKTQQLVGTPSFGGSFDVALIVSDGTNDIKQSFTIIVAGVKEIRPILSAGTTNETTTITYTPSSGNSLKYMFSNSSVTIPKHEQSIPLEAISYISGTDISSAQSGKYLVVYEVNSNGDIIGFFQKVLVSEDIYSEESGDSDTPVIASNDLKVVEITLSKLGFTDIKNSNEKSNYVTTDLILISSYTTGFGDATISWESSDDSALNNSGVVNATALSKQITLIATITSGDISRKKLIYVTIPSNILSDNDIVQKVQNSLVFDSIKNKNLRRADIYSDLNLSISSLFGTDIVWSSTNTSVIAVNGTVVKQNEDTNVTITANISKGTESNSTLFNLIVKKDINTDKAKVLADKKSLSPLDFLGNNRDTKTIIENLVLPVIGKNGSTISWNSSDISINTNNTVTRTGSDNFVTLTATITSGSQSEQVVFTLKVLKYDTSDILSFRETNTTIKGEPNKNEVGNITTLTTTFDVNGEDKNSIVTITGLTYESTRQTDTDGSLKTALEFIKEDAQKLTSSTLYQNPNGTIENIIELKDENNETKIAKISSLISATNMSASSDLVKLDTNLSGTTVAGQVNKDGSLKHVVSIGSYTTEATSYIADTSILIKEDGEVETVSSFDENTTISAIGKLDGSAQHKFTKNGITSKATVSIVGGQTEISANGSVETKLAITGISTNNCAGSYYADIVTDINGKTITKFKNNDESCYKSPTLVDGEDFPAGSESNITQDSSGIVHIQTTLPSLKSDTQFTIE